MIYTILETIAASLFLICMGFIAYWIFRWVQGVSRRYAKTVTGCGRESVAHAGRPFLYGACHQ